MSVSGPSGYAFTQWYDASAVCGETTCSIANATSGLAAGAYTWKVQTWNTVGYGPWSSDMSFSIPIPWPAQPTLISPDSSTTDLTPTYSWNAVSSETGDPATWYYLSVDGPAGNIINQWYTAAAVGCSSGSGTCSITPGVVHMPIGTYDWSVLGYNAAGNGPWSDGMSFTLASTGGFTSDFTWESTGWTQQNGTWGIYNTSGTGIPSNFYTWGAYQTSKSASYATTYANFDYSARFRREGCVWCDNLLYVRGTPSPLQSYGYWSSGYLFVYANDGYFAVVKTVGGTWSVLQDYTYTSAIAQNGWNTLRVVASDSNLYFYINGTLVWTGTDSSLTSGLVGVGMENFEDSVTFGDTVRVDWATLSSYAEELPVITDTVSPEQQALNDAANAGGAITGRWTPPAVSK
jgi:hypothetical protein